MEGLEHDAHMVAAEPGQGVFVHILQDLARNLDPASAGPFQASHHRHQGGLAGTRWADQADGFTPGDREANAA